MEIKHAGAPSSRRRLLNRKTSSRPLPGWLNTRVMVNFLVVKIRVTTFYKLKLGMPTTGLNPAVVVGGTRSSGIFYFVPVVLVKG